ncbi:hypothetical protein U9M48_002312 [Paspalum notatum var. saurae]|uniref:Uncharacterized protein n=1 Tax=Paspalum notatum var. saurae TaxID=547442 RepID=A0AAQ3PQ88_PASNO
MVYSSARPPAGRGPTESSERDRPEGKSLLLSSSSRKTHESSACRSTWNRTLRRNVTVASRKKPTGASGSDSRPASRVDLHLPPSDLVAVEVVWAAHAAEVAARRSGEAGSDTGAEGHSVLGERRGGARTQTLASPLPSPPPSPSPSSLSFHSRRPHPLFFCSWPRRAGGAWVPYAWRFGRQITGSAPQCWPDLAFAASQEVRYCVRGCACLAVCRRRAAVVEAREEAGARPCRPEARDTHGTVLAAPHTPAPTGGHAPRLLLLRVLWQWRPPMSTATSVLPAASGAMDGLSNFSNGLLSGSIETPVRRRGKLQRPLMKHTCLHPLLNIERLQLPLKNISAAAITPGSKRSTAQKSPATARIESGSSQPGKSTHPFNCLFDYQVCHNV